MKSTKHLVLYLLRVKGNKQRLVPIGEPALNAVKQYLAELRPYLLRFEDGRDEGATIVVSHWKTDRTSGGLANHPKISEARRP